MEIIDYNLIAIAAVGKNLELGKGEDLIWSFKADLSRFKRLTLNKVLIMGRKTFESLPEQFRPLPDRTSIILTRDESYSINDSNCLIVNSRFELDEQIQKLLQADLSLSKDVYVIGGAEIYNLLYPALNKLKLTHIDLEDPSADAYFPDIDFNSWNIELTHYEVDSPSGALLKYVDYNRSF